MPTVLQFRGYSFRFYSVDRNEPAHVHVYSAGKRAKFWLFPIAWHQDTDFKRHELHEIAAIIEEHHGELVRQWNEFFGRVK